MTEWIDIAKYRDFHDVPRIFVVIVDSRTFLFDCPFDEKLDDYPGEYAVYELLHLRPDTMPNDWTELSRQAADYKGRVPIRDVTFDASKRKQMKCAAVRNFIAVE